MREYERGSYYDAQLAFTEFIREHPGSVLVDQAIYHRGLSYFEQKDWVLAGGDFERLITDFPESASACDAEFHLAEVYWKQSRKAALDQKETRLAMQQYERFRGRCPEHSKVAGVEAQIAAGRDRLAAKRLANARVYITSLKHPRSGLVYLDLLLDEYPDSEPALRGRNLRARTLLELGELERACTDYAWLQEHGALDPDTQKAFYGIECSVPVSAETIETGE